jgi:hypothetical protein
MALRSSVYSGGLRLKASRRKAVPKTTTERQRSKTSAGLKPSGAEPNSAEEAIPTTFAPAAIPYSFTIELLISDFIYPSPSTPF